MSDYIQRKEVLQAIAGLLNVVESMDAVDGNALHGKWRNNGDLVTCSVCGNSIIKRFNDIRNYCPCCGAKMDKEQEHE